MANANDSPLITTPIDKEKIIDTIWQKYYADKYNNIINIIKNALQNAANKEQIHTALLKSFPLQEDFWKAFAYDPKTLPLNKIKEGLDRLSTITILKTIPNLTNAINIYLDQYNMMVSKLNKPVLPKSQKNNTKPTVNTAKIKYLQNLLGVNPVGFWNDKTNTVFLNWLRNKGWNKYIMNNRFIGKIDDVIRALLIEKTKPKIQSKLSFFLQKQILRLERLNKI